jgi:hypothetical protein
MGLLPPDRLKSTLVVLLPLEIPLPIDEPALLIPLPSDLIPDESKYEEMMRQEVNDK